MTLRDWANAAADYRDAIKLDSNLGPAYLGAAWIMATCPDERFRNPEMAIKTAQRAMELEGDSDPRYTEALAAAYANSGQYDSAVAILKPLIEKLPRNQQAGALARLELYKAETPFRDGVSQPATARTRQPAPQAQNPPPQNRPQARQSSRPQPFGR
ncbi:MAG: hypothetical protein SGJ20_18850, partial [Planctomycetota bacterium]|nr:hypothetical protein [Planctomycetota bacterium]